MKHFLNIIGIVFLGLLIMMFTTLLFELKFIQEFVVRQLIVYLLIGIEFFIFFKILLILYKTKGAD